MTEYTASARPSSIAGMFARDPAPRKSPCEGAMVGELVKNVNTFPLTNADYRQSGLWRTGTCRT